MKCFILFLSLVGLSACGYMTINVDSSAYEGRTGIVVTASHLKEQTFLYLNQGVQISFSDSKTLVVPWGESKFIELVPGSHNYKIWFNYSGKSGFAQDCIIVSAGHTFLLEYKTPFTVGQGGKVQMKNLTINEPVQRC